VLIDGQQPHGACSHFKAFCCDFWSFQATKSVDLGLVPVRSSLPSTGTARSHCCVPVALQNLCTQLLWPQRIVVPYATDLPWCSPKLPVMEPQQSGANSNATRLRKRCVTSETMHKLLLSASSIAVIQPVLFDTSSFGAPAGSEGGPSRCWLRIASGRS